MKPKRAVTSPHGSTPGSLLASSGPHSDRCGSPKAIRRAVEAPPLTHGAASPRSSPPHVLPLPAETHAGHAPEVQVDTFGRCAESQDHLLARGAAKDDTGCVGEGLEGA